MKTYQNKNVNINNIGRLKTSTHAVGGGEWSIEVRTSSGVLLAEFVGLNGTRDNEEPTDLWAEFEEWENNLFNGKKSGEKAKL